MCYKFYNLEKLDFLTSEEEEIKYFTYDVNDGTVDESVFNKVFEKIKLNKYTEKEAIIVVKNLIIASFLVQSQRTDYQTPCYEALLHVLSFIDIEGSANLKILYSLFSVMTVIKKDKDNKEYYVFSNVICNEVFRDFNRRLEYLSKKDKNLKIANEIETVYNDLKKKII